MAELTEYQRGELFGWRWLGQVGARSDRGAFDVVCMQVAAYQNSRETKDREQRAWALGFLRAIRPGSEQWIGETEWPASI